MPSLDSIIDRMTEAIIDELELEHGVTLTDKQWQEARDRMWPDCECAVGEARLYFARLEEAA